MIGIGPKRVHCANILEVVPKTDDGSEAINPTDEEKDGCAAHLYELRRVKIKSNIPSEAIRFYLMRTCTDYDPERPDVMFPIRSNDLPGIDPGASASD